MSYSVLPLAEIHFVGLHRALDIVAREKRFLAFTQAPPLEAAISFYRDIIANDACHFVAVNDATVVGWCDVLPTHGEARAHVGHLGIGLVPEARHQGLGSLLMQAAIAKARIKGLTRIELTVRADNSNAKVLYERFGFVLEGVQRRAMRIDGRYHDAYAMALLL
ncbi:GNAT family N-acetyltransferase [Steroidobacter cummioxidans]|uniref:GNAT family N-acetyltransferase n=1 Tax=Steroidobacter cummioxidans TaxID=1803913 RepID=UPI000E3114F2|nr:GNAT family N-acetyltransferase [Steroidobacter cummioxidans]